MQVQSFACTTQTNENIRARVRSDRMTALSVVVPTCNNDSLTICIQSLLIQQFTDYEIIVVDCAYHEPVHTFCTTTSSIYAVQQGEGLNDARNKGMSLSKSNIVLFLDDDTYIPKNFLKDVLCIFQQNPDLDVAGFLDKPFTTNTYTGKAGRYVENFSRKYFVKPVYKIKGAALAVKKCGILFDAKRKYYDADDTEFVYRMSLNQKKIQYFTHPYLYHDARSLWSFLRVAISMKSVYNLEVPGYLQVHNIVQTGLVFFFGITFLCGVHLPLLLGGLAAFFLSFLIAVTESHSVYYGPGILLHILLNAVYKPAILIVYTLFKVKQKIYTVRGIQ